MDSLWLNPKDIRNRESATKLEKEGSETIESIIQKKYLYEEASRVEPLKNNG